MDQLRQLRVRRLQRIQSQIPLQLKLKNQKVHSQFWNLLSSFFWLFISQSAETIFTKFFAKFCLFRAICQVEKLERDVFVKVRMLQKPCSSPNFAYWKINIDFMSFIVHFQQIIWVRFFYFRKWKLSVQGFLRPEVNPARRPFEFLDSR